MGRVEGGGGGRKADLQGLGVDEEGHGQEEREVEQLAARHQDPPPRTLRQHAQARTGRQCEHSEGSRDSKPRDRLPLPLPCL